MSRVLVLRGLMWRVEQQLSASLRDVRLWAVISVGV